MLARPDPSSRRYSPECVEGKFCEVDTYSSQTLRPSRKSLRATRTNHIAKNGITERVKRKKPIPPGT